MEHMYSNGTRASSIGGAVWVKARASDAVNNCVEIARVEEGEVALRNSRFPDGPALVFTRAEMIAFIAGVRAGEFDAMTV
ncbi:DUF397 domain-containing protein [Streptomyces sp. NPDC098789]|uniref:DUF397 domain-containing protein n=1 Tax=Streptomyces sp. NPDC098789 TaxID=3366098 RepID=UPI003809D431